MSNPSSDSVESPRDGRRDDAKRHASSSFERVNNDSRAVRFAAGSSIQSMLYASSSSTSFSAANGSSMTSFGSFDEYVDGHLPAGNQLARVGEQAEKPATIGELLTDATTSRSSHGAQEIGVFQEQDQSHIPRSQSAKMTITTLDPALLGHIFAIVATQSYAARRILPCVCRLFQSVASQCPEMWDTFEIMTRNADALTSRRQVEYILEKAGVRRLSVGLGISNSESGSWNGIGNDGAEVNAVNGDPAHYSSHIRGARMIHWVATFMERVEDLVLDVQDGDLDPQMEGAMLDLFADSHTTHLRRLTILGNYQLDRIIKLKTPSTRTSSPSLIPSLSALRTLTLAFTSSFSLPSQLPQLIDLRLSVINVDSSNVMSPFHDFLLCFPNLVCLAIHCLSSENGYSIPTYDNSISSRPAQITMHRLKKLVLDGLPLTCPILTYLSTPNLLILELNDFDLGFDPRDIGFDTTLIRHDTNGNVQHGLRPLPFGDFLSNNAHWGTLRVLKLMKLPGVVARMCVDFARIVSGERESAVISNADGNGGLTHLSLADFAWSDWESLLGWADASRSEPLVEASPPRPSPSACLPYLRSLHVHLDHVSAWKTAGFMNGKHEDRQVWMDGLMEFAGRRMSRRAVAGMLKGFGIDGPDWLLEGEGRGSLGEPRTVEQISLDTGFTDSQAFTHSAWLVLQKEHGESATD